MTESTETPPADGRVDAIRADLERSLEQLDELGCSLAAAYLSMALHFLNPPPLERWLVAPDALIH